MSRRNSSEESSSGGTASKMGVCRQTISLKAGAALLASTYPPEDLLGALLGLGFAAKCQPNASRPRVSPFLLRCTDSVLTLTSAYTTPATSQPRFIINLQGVASSSRLSAQTASLARAAPIARASGVRSLSVTPKMVSTSSMCCPPQPADRAPSVSSRRLRNSAPNETLSAT